MREERWALSLLQRLELGSQLVLAERIRDCFWGWLVCIVYLIVAGLLVPMFKTVEELRHSV